MPTHVSSYKNGLDRDSSKNKYQPDSYYQMKNMRITSFEELSNGAVQSIEGNTISISNPLGYTDHIIIGNRVVRDFLVVWSTPCNDTTGGLGTIWYTRLSDAIPSWTKVYEHANMMLSAQFPIYDEAIGFYEKLDNPLLPTTTDIVKVYWTDFHNMLRFINIFADNSLLPVDQLNILPNVRLYPPTVVNIGSGNLYVGKIQYAVQYYNIGGVETTFSICTPLVHLTASNEHLSGNDIRTYIGNDALDASGNPNNAGKSVFIRLDNVDTNYEKVRVVSILYRNLDQEPEIHIVGEYDTSEDLIVVDYGNYTKGTLTLNAFRTLGNHELYCKTIAQRGNKALIGNIEERFFDIDFDARAYRYGPTNTGGLTLTDSEQIHITSLSDLIVGSCDANSLYFDPTTPAIVSTKDTDTLTGNSAFVTLHAEYLEHLTIASGSGQCDIGSTTYPSGTYTAEWVYKDVNHVRMLITGFSVFAIEKLGVNPLNDITDVVSLIAVVDLQGLYNSTTLGDDIPFSDFTGVGIVHHYDDGSDELTIEIETSGVAFFDHFSDFASGGVQFARFGVNYEYDLLHTYDTVNPADVNITTDTALANPAQWLFHIDKVAGTWFTLSTVFDPTDITAIDLTLSLEYTYTTFSKRIKVYSTKHNAEHDIVFNNVAWPNTTYQMTDPDTAVFGLVPEDHDCINPFNYDHLYNNGTEQKIDEIATYCGVGDFALNPLNNNEANNSNQYKWQSDMTTIGGEGLNVKYEFCHYDMLIDKSSDTRYDEPDTVTIESFEGYSSYKNPIIASKYLSGKRDEVYRYGIVFVSDKGQDSFTKWIGDIKFPNMNDTGFQLATNALRECTVKAIGIKFDVNVTGLYAQGVRGFKIVRVKREKQDRSIYSQGAVGAMVSDVNNSRITALSRLCLTFPQWGLDTGVTMNREIIQFVSPEVNFFKDLQPNSSHYIKYAAVLGDSGSRYSYMLCGPDGATTTFNALADTDEATFYTVGKFSTEWTISTNKYLETTNCAALSTHNIKEGTIAGIVEHGAESENSIIFDGVSNPVINRVFEYFPDPFPNPVKEGPSGTCMILSFDNVLNTAELNYVTAEYDIFLVDYKIPSIAASQYGGLTYEARQANTYIECGHYTEVALGDTTLTGIDVYGGDTYIGLYEHNKTMWEADANTDGTNYDIEFDVRISHTVLFPCESVINIDIAHGDEYSTNYDNPYIYALREDPGSYDYDRTHNVIPTPQLFLVQTLSHYLYNSVYSQQNTTKAYFSKPDNWSSEIIEDTLVKISEEKYPREDVEAFMKYLTDNEKLLPTHYGQIQDLFEFKNFMIVWFDHAFGTITVDERALLPVQNNSILELGAADNLKFFDYLSNKSGTVHPQSIDYCGDGFVWYDAHLGALGYYNGSTQDIGLAKGMSSFLKPFSELINSSGNYYRNPFAGGNILCYENKKYKETLCSFQVSELVSWSSNTATSVIFTLAYSVETNYDTYVLINGESYIAHVTTGPGPGILTINTTDNVSLNVLDPKWNTGYFHIYYKDLSKTLSFSSIINAFMYEVDIFPTWFIEYKEDLYDVYGKFQIYKENYGNYGRFYGDYRYGELEYLINPRGSAVCLYNNFEYAMEFMDQYGNNLLNNTWDSIQLYNDYQWGGSTGLTCTLNLTGRVDPSVIPHTLITGDRVMFSGTLPIELENDIMYYVINPTAHWFYVSTSMNGTPITFSTVGASVSFHTIDIPISTITTVINDKRRFRTWRIKDTRDMKGYTTGALKPRLRDTYLRVLFKYMHESNKRIIMHDLNTFYTITRESYSKF